MGIPKQDCVHKPDIETTHIGNELLSELKHLIAMQKGDSRMDQSPHCRTEPGNLHKITQI